MSLDDVCQKLWVRHKVINVHQFEKDEDTRRLQYFKEIHDFIQNHNERSDKTYSCQHNSLSHLSRGEYFQSLGYKPEIESNLKKKKKDKPKTKIVKPKLKKCPTHWDWRRQGAVTEVKNQGNCGSCWAHAVTCAIEGSYCQLTGELISFSEQQLVDCCSNSLGCNGGKMSDAFDYIQAKGITTRKNYPYEGSQSNCEINVRDYVIQIAGYQKLPSENERFQSFIHLYGCAAVSIDASDIGFQTYYDGIYNGSRNQIYCHNHAVAVVGYGYKNNQKYWVVKNSWSYDWGDGGFVKIGYGPGDLGITTNAYISYF